MPAALPPTLVKGLSDLATVSQPHFAQFIAFLRSIPVEIKQHRVFNTPDIAVDDLPDKGISLKDAAFSLLLSRAGSHIPATDFVEQLCQTLTPSLDPESLTTLRRRVSDILSIESLDRVA